MTTVQKLNNIAKMNDTMPTLRKIQRGASQPKSQRFCTTFNFDPTHLMPTYHPDKQTNTNLLNMKKIIILSFLLFTCLTGFSQSYLGRVTKQVNFREGAGTDYPVISSLKVGTQIFIVSLETENDFYNIIDIATDKEGYIHKSFVKLGDIVEKNERGMFTPSGKTSTYNPEIEIFNNTSLSLTLKLNSETYTFSPKQKKTIALSPGTYSYRASAPGVIPNIGTVYMERNMGYTWQFYIVTERR
jgi:hypothetical protein